MMLPIFSNAIRFSDFEFETGENAAHFSPIIFMLFDVPNLSPFFPRSFSFSKGICCPFLSKNFSCYSIFWFWVWNREKCCLFFPIIFHAIRFPNFEAGENVAHFPWFFSCYSISDFEFLGKNRQHFPLWNFKLNFGKSNSMKKSWR